MNNQTMSELVDLLNDARNQASYWNHIGNEYQGTHQAHTSSEAYGMARAYGAITVSLERILVADADRREAAGESAEETECEKCGASE